MTLIPLTLINGLPSLGNQSRAPMNALVLRYLPGILFNTKGKVLLQAMGITHQYNYELAATVLTKMTEEHTTATNIRIQALNLLNIRFPSNPIIGSKGLLNRPLLDIRTAIISSGISTRRSGWFANFVRIFSL